jgi:hypothetical protein
MPITEKEKATLNELIGKMNSPMELIGLAGTVYQTILDAKLPSEHLMLLGKLIYARTPWNQIPNHLRLPFIRSAEETLLRKIPDLYEIVPEEENVENEIADAEAAALAGQPTPESAPDDFPTAPDDELDPPKVEAKPDKPKRERGEKAEKTEKVEKPEKPEKANGTTAAATPKADEPVKNETGAAS